MFAIQRFVRMVAFRWTYPIVPEMFQNNGPSVTYSRNNIYLSDTVTLTR